jgi:hypothetical protein
MTLTSMIRRRPSTVLIWGLILFLTLEPCALSLAQTQSSCAAKLKQAETRFDSGDFDGSIVLLEECLKVGEITQQEKIRVYELLAQNYTSKSYLEQATNAIRSLLELVPNYRPDPDQYSPAFVAQVEQVRSEMAREERKPVPKGKPEKVEEAGFPQTWHLIAGGAVVAGVAAYFIFKGEEEKTQVTNLPGPPGRP